MTALQTEHIVVLVTASGEEEAQTIATQLIEAKVAACVNTINGITSMFSWQGKVETERESLLIIKSSASLLSKVIEVVKQTHSYEVPEIIALPVVGGNEDYLAWIDAEVKR